MIFSVIIPTLNRKEKLKSCLKSLYEQDFPKDQYEILVVDDGSTDGTSRELAKDTRIILLRLSKNAGPSKARNFGAQSANGKYLAFTDSDCLAPENWLKKMYETFLSHSDASAVGGSLVTINNSIFGKYETQVYKSYVKKNSEYVSKKRDEAPFALGNMVYLKSAYVDVGGFSDFYPAHVSGEDSYLKLKLLKRKKKIIYVPCDVLHDHDYTFMSFRTQCMERGAGMLLDSKLKGKMQKKVLILSRLLLTPLYLCYSLIRFKFELDLVFCDSLFYFYRNVGKLKFYSLIKETNLEKSRAVSRS